MQKSFENMSSRWRKPITPGSPILPEPSFVQMGRQELWVSEKPRFQTQAIWWRVLTRLRPSGAAAVCFSASVQVPHNTQHRCCIDGVHVDIVGLCKGRLHGHAGHWSLLEALTTVDGWAHWLRSMRDQVDHKSFVGGQLAPIASVWHACTAVIPAHVKFSICVVGLLPLKLDNVYIFKLFQ